jgi:transcriptional regulator with XRE-family HTH domain
MTQTLFGEQLQKLREQRGWNRLRMARELQLSPSHYTRLEQGEHQPTWITVIRLASILGVTTEYFQKQEGRI